MISDTILLKFCNQNSLINCCSRYKLSRNATLYLFCNLLEIILFFVFMIFKKLITILIFSLFANFTFAQNLDIDLLRDINVNRNKSLDPTFKLISKTATPASLSVPLGFLIAGVCQNNKLLLKNSYQTGITIAGTMMLSTILKYGINRTRPYKKYTDIENVTSDFTPSFPSGHTTSAFSTATTLSLMYPKWYVIIPSYTWASAVAYSRLHMGMHFPSDVLAGIILGMGTSYLSYRLQKRYK
jgi:membrane-associated phospholipid phosphatase